MTESDPVSNSQPQDVWSRFHHDPRNPDAASLRASDQDREVVVEVLAEAYSDGRLDREEFDARSASAQGAKLLGDLPPLVEDLVPVDVTTSPALASSAELQDAAQRSYKRQLHNAIGAWVGPSALTTGIWGATSFAQGDPYFFWPVFVILGTGINLARTVFAKQDIIEHKREKLERQQRRELERRRRDQPGPDTAG